MRTKHRGWRWALVALGFGCSVAQAWVSDGKALWPQGDITMQLQLDAPAPTSVLADGSTSWNQVASAALADWNQYLTVSKFTSISGSSAPIAAQNGLNNVFWSDTVYGEAWGSTTIGITLAWYRDNVRAEADVIFNRSGGAAWDSYRGALRTGTGNQRINDLRRVALHEFGHTLGLDHPDDFNQSVAAVMNSLTSNLDDLQPDDIAGAQHFYQAALPPTILTQPAASQAAPVGGNATFSVTVGGTPPFTYQWYRNRVALTDSPVFQSSGFSFSSLQLSDAGVYQVTITNSAGATTSAAALLSVGSALVAPVITAQPAAQTMLAGARAALSVAASGTAPLSYQWFKDGASLVGATAATYALAAVQVGDAGTYHVTVTNGAGSVVSDNATLTVTTGVTDAAYLSNLSVRATMSPGQTLIVGLSLASGTESVLVRGIGPGLTKVFPSLFPADAVMPDPRLSFYANGAASPSLTNDNWDAALADTFTTLGAFPLDRGSTDAAFLRDMHDANNSVWIQGTGAGIVLVEAYGLSDTTTPRLINLSARNFVGTGNDVLIAGFFVGGSGTKKLLIRAVGPGLAAFGVPGTLADPLLEVYRAADPSTPLATNDNWDASSVKTVADSVNAFSIAPGSRDSALLLTVPAGAGYTANVKGADGGTGEALVEVYEVP